MNKILPFVAIAALIVSCQQENHEPREVEVPWYNQVYFYGEFMGATHHIPPDRESYIFDTDVETWADIDGINALYKTTITFDNNVPFEPNMPEFHLELGPAQYQSMDSVSYDEFEDFFEEGEHAYVFEDSVEQGARIDFSYIDTAGHHVTLSSAHAPQPEDSLFEIVDSRLREVVIEEVEEGEDVTEKRMYIRAKFEVQLYDLNGEHARMEKGDVVTYFLNES